MQSTALLRQRGGCRSLGQNRKAGERLTTGESDGGERQDPAHYTNQEGRHVIWKGGMEEGVWDNFAGIKVDGWNTKAS